MPSNEFLMAQNTQKKFKTNKSPVGWYLASYLQRAVLSGEESNNPNKRYTTWENTILIKAKTSEEAYKKAVKMAKGDSSSYKNIYGQRVKWKFEGLISLVPINEKLEDGAELIWRDLSKFALKTNRKRIKRKNELEAFC
jgi:hypothetical protein